MRAGGFAGLAFASAALAVEPASAHVVFDVEQGAVFQSGATETIAWHLVIGHDTQAYHLELIEAPGTEPVSIARGLPPDTFSYDWQVPDSSCESCQLHVIQDNSGADYDALVTIDIEGGDGGAAGGEPPDAGCSCRLAAERRTPVPATIVVLCWWGVRRWRRPKRAR